MKSHPVSTKYVSLPHVPDMSDVCLMCTMQFYDGLTSIIRQMSDVSLPPFAYTAHLQLVQTHIAHNPSLAGSKLCQRLQKFIFGLRTNFRVFWP